MEAMAKPVIALAALLAVFSESTASRPSLNGKATEAFHAPIHEFPYQADIRHNGRHVCSGAVLGEYDVLTAAHCIEGLKKDDLTVIVGKEGNNRTQGIHEVAKVQHHPLFNAHTMEYDVAIIKVQKPFRFGRYIDSVLIPQPGENVSPGEHGVVSGWTEQSNDGGHDLMAANVMIISREECNQHNSIQNAVTDHMICSGSSSNAAVSCLADPGAPLVIDGKLYGIASWGDACAPGAPSIVVYTDVSKLDYFLRKNTFIYENARSELCAALQLIISLLPMIPVIPAWVVTALNLLLSILGC